MLSRYGVNKSRRAVRNALHVNEEREEQIATIIARAKRLLEKAASRNVAPPLKPQRKRQPRP